MEHEPPRTVPRFPFAADAVIIPENSEVKINTRVRELSLRGCYLTAANPLPRGTAVTVKIHTETDFFESRATVVYSELMLGMGLAFRELKPHFLSILQNWLRTAMAASPRKD
jgi:hypothetical protein